MATQTYVTHTDMQALSQAAVQVQQATNQAGTVTQKSNTPSIPQTAILQSTQAGGQQFIVTIGDPNGEQVQQVQELHVPGGSQQIIYQQNSQQYADYGQGAMYTPVSGTYYTQGPGGGQMTSGLSQLQGQILTHGGGTYLVQGGAMDADGTPLAHTARASPATDSNDPRNSHFDVKSWQREVQWLIDNYETAEGVSLPRSTLYNHYLRHCQEQKIDPMNPASFGKLIRSVFLGLRTRRLGTRGNSKYHYYGIRIKATSPLNQFTDETTMAIRQQPLNPGKSRFKSSMTPGSSDSQDGTNQGENSQQHQHQQFLGDASGAIPNFDMVEVDSDLPAGITQDDVDIFEHIYQQHCECILELVVNLQFSLIEDLWQSFWRVRVKQEVQQNGSHEDEQRLPKDKLFTLSQYPPVQKFVRKSDYAFFQALVEVLIPDVLRPIPSSLTQAIRNFAKSLEGWLKNAMVGVPEEMYKAKLGAVSAFAQTLRRYTSLNHLAQAARAVLQNTTQINQMLSDLNRVDFANVQEQASWVCQCDDGVVHQLEQDFKKTLQGQNSLEQWAVWLESVVNEVLQPHEGSHNFPKAARQFLLKWSFYSSMVIRDLTLRSAASFGSFHLIRLLYDEYMFYLVEHKVAAATGETPIAVMGEVKQLMDLGNVMALGSLDTESAAQKNEASAAVASISKPPKVSQPQQLQQLQQQQQQQQQQQHQTIITKPSGTNLTQLTTMNNSLGGYSVVSSSTSGSTKTIVVVPVSSASGMAVSASHAASGDGQQPMTKKIKLSN